MCARKPDSVLTGKHYMRRALHNPPGNGDRTSRIGDASHGADCVGCSVHNCSVELHDAFRVRQAAGTYRGHIRIVLGDICGSFNRIQSRGSGPKEIDADLARGQAKGPGSYDYRFYHM